MSLLIELITDLVIDLSLEAGQAKNWELTNAYQTTIRRLEEIREVALERHVPVVANGDNE